MSKVDISQAYWDNNGKYQEQYNKAWKQLIPASGEAKDGLPEALRAISRIGYDYYNNGFCNLWRSSEAYDSDGCYYDEYEMDSYYEELVDYLRYEIPSLKTCTKTTRVPVGCPRVRQLERASGHP